MKKIFDAHGNDSEEVEVIRELTDDECDKAEVGKMFRIRFDDGYETDAFEDELE